MKRLYRFKSLCTEFQNKPLEMPTEEEISTEEMLKIKLTYFNIEGVAEKVCVRGVCVRERERDRDRESERELNHSSKLIPYPALRQVRLALKIGGLEFEDVRVNFPDWPGNEFRHVRACMYVFTHKCLQCLR